MRACRAIIFSYFDRQTGWVVRRDELSNVSSNENVWRGNEILLSTERLLLVFITSSKPQVNNAPTLRLTVPSYSITS